MIDVLFVEVVAHLTMTSGAMPKIIGDRCRFRWANSFRLRRQTSAFGLYCELEYPLLVTVYCRPDRPDELQFSGDKALSLIQWLAQHKVPYHFMLHVGDDDCENYFHVK